MRIWSPKDLNTNHIQFVAFRDGSLFVVLRDRAKASPRYSLGDELGRIEGKPQHQGPMSEELLLSILNSEGARPVSAGDAAQIRADHRVRVKNKEDLEA